MKRSLAFWGRGASAALAQPIPDVTVGRIERMPAIASKHVDGRPVDVWLPADYSPAKRYNVLYMHDGQIPGTLARINSLYIDVEKTKP